MKKGYRYVRALKEKKIRDNLPIHETWVFGEPKPIKIRWFNYTTYKKTKRSGA